jgi:RNA polymerase sigma-70 factor (ECF subfamily)
MRRASGAGRERWDWRTLAQVALQEAKRILGSVYDAEDAAQEAMIRAYRAQARCATPEAPHAWIRAIARREAYRLYSRRSVPPTDVPPPDESRPEDVAETVVARLAAATLLQRLPTSERRLLVRRYVLDQTSFEIADALAMPAATVRVRLHRAVKRLREEAEDTPGITSNSRGPSIGVQLEEPRLAADSDAKGFRAGDHIQQR